MNRIANPVPRRWQALACSTLLLASAASAQIDCSSPGTVTPTGAKVAIASNPQYFTYKGQLLPLVGMSHEYICHIAQPLRDAEYCTLATYPAVFATMKTNKNNVQRLWTIFNHSPGLGPTGAPYAHEQPFLRTGGKWDLRTINQTYLNNLEKVVCEAYKNDIVIELTLLDPWDGDWTTGPFNAANTVTYPDPANVAVNVTPGFSQKAHFLSYETGAIDTSSAAKEARKGQKLAIQSIVNKLKRWPNLIWEIANESDFDAVTPANLNTFQNSMIAHVKTFDTTHPIMVNSHTSGTFAWNLTGATAQGLHYTRITDGRYGAIELQRDTGPLAAARAGYPLSFNENRFISGSARTAIAVRSEAWEFMLNEGGIFDAYSIDRSALSVQNASTQIKALYNFLTGAVVSPVPASISNLATVQQTTCNGASDWCTGLPAYGASDQGTCTAQAANAYWATMKSNTDLAVYIHHATQMPGTYGGWAPKSCDNMAPGTGFRNPSFQYRVPQTGCWSAVWIDPFNGSVIAGGLVNLVANTWNSPSTYPYYRHDIAFLARFVQAGSC
jgi:hypothetical protein